MMPIASTAMISAFSPGFAMNATSICLCSTKATRPTRTTKTSILNRKIRGDDSLRGSSSLAMGFNVMRIQPLRRTMAQTRDRKKGVAPEPWRITIKLPIELKLRCLRWAGCLQQGEQPFMDRLVGGENVTLAEYFFAAIAVCDEPAGLAHHDQSGRRIPGVQASLPIAVDPSSRDPGEIERRGTKASQARHVFLHDADLPA